MADQMAGGVRYTAQGLTIQAVDPEQNLILVRGALPGPKGGPHMLIRTAAKACGEGRCEVTTLNILAWTKRKKAGSVELPANLEAQVNIPLMHQVVWSSWRRPARAAQDEDPRRGLRWRPQTIPAEGNGSRTRQDLGAGQAAAGGGVAHRPRPPGLLPSTNLTKKMKAAAPRAAPCPTARARASSMSWERINGETPKTKTALATLAAVTKSDKVLVVFGHEDDVSWLSLRNVPEVHLLAADQLNTYDVLADEVIFTKAALEEFGEFLHRDRAGHHNRGAAPKGEKPH